MNARSKLYSDPTPPTLPLLILNQRIRCDNTIAKESIWEISSVTWVWQRNLFSKHFAETAGREWGNRERHDKDHWLEGKVLASIIFGILLSLVFLSTFGLLDDSLIGMCYCSCIFILHPHNPTQMGYMQKIDKWPLDCKKCLGTSDILNGTGSLISFRMDLDCIYLHVTPFFHHAYI